MEDIDDRALFIKGRLENFLVGHATVVNQHVHQHLDKADLGGAERSVAEKVRKLFLDCSFIKAHQAADEGRNTVSTHAFPQFVNAFLKARASPASLSHHGFQRGNILCIKRACTAQLDHRKVVVVFLQHITQALFQLGGVGASAGQPRGHLIIDRELTHLILDVEDNGIALSLGYELNQ